MMMMLRVTMMFMMLTIRMKDDDGDDDCHRNILCITDAASQEMMRIVRIMMIRMRTVMITLIVASSALPMLPSTVMTTIIVASSALLMLPNGTPEIYINVNERDHDVNVNERNDDDHHGMY